jgi:glycosyltransferase involved in cell wall biosynthesis
VITFTQNGQDAGLPFEVYRRPGIRTILKLLRWSELYVQHNVSFRLLWPILFCWRPLVCVHHGFYVSSRDTIVSWQYRLKHLVTLFSTNIAVSHAIAATIPGKSHVVANPYDENLFFRLPHISKNRALFFVGRIVSDKGIDVLIDAVAKLRDRSVQAPLTVAGSGPEESAIRQKVNDLRLAQLVTFVGRVTDRDLNELLNEHRIMVVPTREGEGFGVVALEGIACGCVVVGSTCGGLPEAIGPCGRVFQNGDPTALADVLQQLITHPESWDKFFEQGRSHLDEHRPSVVAERYLTIFRELLHTGKRS